MLYYHGTDNRHNEVKKILKSGLVPNQRGNYAGPSQSIGHVYLTNSLEEALAHAAGAYYDNENDVQRYGYIFIIDGSQIKNPTPDEDVIVDYLNAMISSSSSSNRPNWVPIFLYDFINRKFPQYKRIKMTEKDSENVENHIGPVYKRVNELAKEIIRTSRFSLSQIEKLGNNFAVPHVVIPKECWKFKSSDYIHILSSKQFFSDYATRIK